MDKNKTAGALIVTLLMTLVVLRKRQQGVGDEKAFQIEFGRGFLDPYLILFSIVFTLLFMAPLDYQLGRETYRQATNYYGNLKDRRAFFRELEADTILVFASDDDERIAKHLELPKWVVINLSSFISTYLQLTKYLPYIAIGVSTSFLTLIIYFKWMT